MASKQILDGLDKRDPDLREMACRDLSRGLIADLKLSGSEELLLANKFIDMMAEDQTLKVLAGQTLVDLLSKSNTPSNIQSSVTTATRNLLLGKHEEDEKTIFEVTTAFIKGLIIASPQPTFPLNNVYEPLLGALLGKNVKIVEYALDILETLLTHWGSHFSQEPNAEKVCEDIQSVALPHLKSANYNIQTKAIGCVGNVSAYLSFDAFEKLISRLVENLKKETEVTGACTALSSLSTICRLSPIRFAGIFPSLVPLLNHFVQASDFHEEADQVRVCEAALIVYDTALVYCLSQATSPHLDTILEQVLQFIGYDPTIIEGDDAEEDNVEEVEVDDEEGVVDESETWRVRKACIRCLGSMVGKWKDGPLNFLDSVGEELLKRFTDTQANVKIEAFKTFAVIVGFVREAIKKGEDKKRFLDWVPDYIVKRRLVKEFKQSAKSNIEAWGLVQEITTILTAFGKQAITDLCPGLVRSLKDKNENLRIAAAKAFGSLVATSPPFLFHPKIKDLVDAIIVTISTPNFKVTATALRTVTHLSNVVRGQPDEIVQKLYAASFNVLSQEGAALEVKEAAITAVGHIIAANGTVLAAQVGTALKVLGDRLSHATTSVAAARAIQVIASVRPVIPLGSTSTLNSQLTDSLKLNNRLVRQTSFEALIAIISASPDSSLPNLEVIANYIESEDLLLANLALKLVSCALKSKPSIVAEVMKVVVPKCMSALKKLSLKGECVTSLAGVVTSIVEANLGYFNELYNQFVGLRSAIGLETLPTATAIAGAIIASKKIEEYISKLLPEVKSSDPLAINTLGEIGSQIDLTTKPDTVKLLTNLLTTSGLASSAGVSSDKSVKHFAARALGNLLVMNLKIVEEVVKELLPKAQHQVVSVLRQLIEKLKAHDLESYGNVFVQNLLYVSESSDLVCDSVADSLAKIIQTNHELIELVKGGINSDRKNRRVAVTKAISLAVNQSDDISLFLPHLAPFLIALKDKELDVRIAGLSLVLTLLSKNLALVKPIVLDHMELIFIETKKRPELISKVTVGGNVLITDLGTPSRRTAFQIIDLLLNSNDLPPTVISQIITSLGSGSKVDEEVEIQMITHKIAVKLATSRPELIIKQIAAFDLTPVCVKLLPSTAIEVDVKANEEIVKSAKQVVAAIEEILYSHKYLNGGDTANLLETFVKSFFGGLRPAKLYKEIYAALAVPTTQNAAVKVLTELWKHFDGKLQNNILHKPIADELLVGLDELLTTPTLKNLTSNKDEAFVRSVLVFLKAVDIAFIRLEKFKADMKTPVNPLMSGFIAHSIKKGPLASKYAEIK